MDESTSGVVQVKLSSETHSRAPRASEPTATSLEFCPANAAMSPVRFAGVNSSWSQVAPPSVVWKMEPSLPATMPTAVFAKRTAVRSLLVGLRCRVCHFGMGGGKAFDPPPLLPPPRQLGASTANTRIPAIALVLTAISSPNQQETWDHADRAARG